MASTITEFFGYSPQDRSPTARHARNSRECPFLKKQCVKKLHGGDPSGVCTLKPVSAGPVICCPVRLYAGEYQILRDVSLQAFGRELPLVAGSDVPGFRLNEPGKEFAAAFGKGWGKELRLPNRSKQGGYYVDWILAHVDAGGSLISFVAIEVQSIDISNNYRAERLAHLDEIPFGGTSPAGLNWENVHKRILSQLIFKGNVLRREPLCQKGLFFICPTPVYEKMDERLGGKMEEIHMHSGSITFMWYDLGPEVPAGQIRQIQLEGQSTTTVEQVINAFTSPSNLPPPRVYEKAIRHEL